MSGKPPRPVPWLAAALLLVAACSGHSAPATAGSSATAGVPPDGPPVVTETFTPVPCDDTTNVGEQGCLEKQVLAADQQVNALVRKYWDAADRTGRTALAKGETAWLAYRTSFCAWQGDQYRDGSVRPVVVAQCLSDVTQQHVKDLRSASPTG